jgi:4-diphosphocytidyl-2-C-methyl-D-erythritol kinase
MAASSSLSAADWRRRWPAPAKLNLFLHVVGRRADGYHLLQTVFRLIDLVDWLEFAPREDGAIRLAQALPGVPEEDDLTVRAAKLLRAAAGSRAGATIAVEKRIPIGGGLGGGSSDAATTLIALNRLWGTGLSRPDLSALAVRLGADIPFFLLGQNAFAEGIGERLTPLDLEPSWYVVITPQLSVSTREIFGSAALTRDTKPLTITAFFAGLGRNDLEPVVCGKFPQVARALEWLKGHGDARMSGSGASVFAAFRTESEARAVVARIPGEWRGAAVRGLERHPLASE